MNKRTTTRSLANLHAWINDHISLLQLRFIKEGQALLIRSGIEDELRSMSMNDLIILDRIINKEAVHLYEVRELSLLIDDELSSKEDDELNRQEAESIENGAAGFM